MSIIACSLESEMGSRLVEWAQKYETQNFVKSDPVQFPRCFNNLEDAEVSAFITSWLAYGRREAIIDVCNRLHQTMGASPRLWLESGAYEEYKYNNRSLYRLYKWNDLYQLCHQIHSLCNDYGSIYQFLVNGCESVGNQDGQTLLELITSYFDNVNGIPKDTSSACKRLCLFLRWMIRRDSPVDLGMYLKISPKALLIPLDTHVHRIALELGLTKRKSADMLTAKEITEAMAFLFPEDPSKGDFALFGYGVNQKP